MRARNIKPGFFKNEELGDLKYEERLLFIGLWCLADREGFFEKRPKKMVVEIFPYDRNIDTEKLNKMLNNLMSKHLITCNDIYGFIPQFLEHQNPHPHEAKSTVPEDIKNILYNQCHDMQLHVTKCNADILNPDILNPDITPPAVKVKKEPYGEFKNVYLLPEEYQKLISRCSLSLVKAKIESLSGGIQSKGYKYKDHYATLLNWLRKDGVLKEINEVKKETVKIECPKCFQSMKQTDLVDGKCRICGEAIK